MRLLRCVLALALMGAASPVLARDQIRIAGSGTVYPFAAMAAEQFGLGGRFKTPIVEATGTGGGFKLFCGGIGLDTPDINDASRPITDSEKALCAANGVTDMAAITIGNDGIVLAGKAGMARMSVSKKQLFMALARQLPDGHGGLAANHFQNWKEIDPSLPDRPIEIYGPPPTSGTRDAFVEMVMEKGCAELVADEAQRAKICRMMREDGRYIEAGEDYNIVVQKLVNDENALGIMGYGFYDENSGKIQAVAVDGVLPGDAGIQSGSYGVSRHLYMYVKTQHIGQVPGLAEFMREVTGDYAIGPDGYLTEKGLLPLTMAEKQAVQKQVSKLTLESKP